MTYRPKIIFEEGKIIIQTPNPNQVIIEKEPLVTTSFNRIIDLFKKYYPKIEIIRNKDNSYQLKQPIGLTTIIQTLRLEHPDEMGIIEYKPLVYGDFRLTLEKADRDQDILLKHLQARKQKYLDNLIRMHIRNYKVVPAKEAIAHQSVETYTKEDAFIFTIPSLQRNCVNIVYENCNEARASIVCAVQETKYQACLQWLYNYMGNKDETNKREHIREAARLNCQGIIYFKSVNHTENTHDWAMRIKTLS